MISKLCSRCKLDLPVSDFKLDKKAKSGYSSCCRKCYAVYMNNYYHNNKDYRDKLKEQGKNNRRALRMEVMSHYSGGKPFCECCKETEYEFLSVDHIDGGGAEHRKQGLTSKAFYRWLKANGLPEGYRVLCMNCNFAIGVHGSCPHQRKEAANAAPISEVVTTL